MMRKKPILILSIAVLCVQSPAFSEDVPELKEDGAIDISMMITRNPFTPQLPPPVKEIVEPVDETPISDGSSQIQVTGVQTSPPEDTMPEILGMPTLTITGLIWNSDRPQAIVNGNIITVGERLFGIPTDKAETIPELEFTGISKDGLEVSYMDKTVIIKPASE